MNKLDEVLSNMGVASIKHALEQLKKYGNNATVDIIPQIDVAKAEIEALIDQRVKEAKKGLCNYNCANCHAYNMLDNVYDEAGDRE